MKLSAKVQKLLASQRTAAKFPYLITIDHDDHVLNRDFPMRFANSSEDITYAGETYHAASFSVQPPDRDGAKIGNATLTISAIDQFWIRKIRANQKPAKLAFVAVIVYDSSNGIEGVEPLEENSFTLRAANFNELAITWTMVFDENMAIQVPADTCNAMTAPGCA